jgi:hypothetical protein
LRLPRAINTPPQEVPTARFHSIKSSSIYQRRVAGCSVTLTASIPIDARFQLQVL